MKPNDEHLLMLYSVVFAGSRSLSFTLRNKNAGRHYEITRSEKKSHFDWKTENAAVRLHKAEMESFDEVNDQLTESMWAEPEQRVQLHNEEIRKWHPQQNLLILHYSVFLCGQTHRL